MVEEDNLPDSYSDSWSQVGRVRAELNELVDSAAYRYVDIHVPSDEPASVLMHTTGDAYSEVERYLDEHGYEFEQLEHGSFQIQDISKERIGDLVWEINVENLNSIIGEANKPRSVDIGTTNTAYHEVADQWEEKGYEVERLPFNYMHIPDMMPEDIDKILSMTGVETVFGSEFDRLS